MEEKNSAVSLYSIKKMVSEENKKTIYTTYGKLNKRLWIIPYSEFRITFEETIPMVSAKHFLDLDSVINHITVIDNSKLLCIKLGDRLEFFNI